MQNKTWGTIITWTYNQPPYLVNGSVMYSQLLLSYMAGAQYAVIFNYPQVGDNPYGVLTEDHFVSYGTVSGKIFNPRVLMGQPKLLTCYPMLTVGVCVVRTILFGVLRSR